MSEEDEEFWTTDEIEEEFPRGDGTADCAAVVRCPHCGELNEITLDPGGGDDQEYVEDCHVCCQPWQMHVLYALDGSATVQVSSTDS